MNKDYVIKLNLAVYKVTELFPQFEPLKYQIRKKANDILLYVIRGENKRKILKEIEGINIYFDLAVKQKWINENNLFILKQEYKKIAEEYEIKPKVKEKKIKDIKKISKIKKISRRGREEEILRLLRNKERVRLSELKLIFPHVSSRTLRRDMEALIKEGKAKRKRDGQKDVSYQFISDRTKSGQNDMSRFTLT